MLSSLLSLSGQVDPSELIPEDWTCNQLGSTCEVFGGGKLGFTKERHYQGSGVTAFSAAGPDGFVEKAEITDRDGVVLSAIGANCGRCFFASGNWTTLANVQAIIPKNGLDARYLFYFVNRVGYWDRSGSAQPFIKPSSVHASWVAYPKAEAEQSKIAEVLSTVDRAIEETEALIAKRQRIKTGLTQDLLTRGIDEHGNVRSEQTHKFKDSLLGRIPVEWEVRDLQSLLANVSSPMRSGPFGSALLKEELVESGVPLLGIDNVLPERFVPDFKRFVSPKKALQLHRYRVRPHDLMITIMGTVGRCCVVPENIGEALSSKHVWTLSLNRDLYSPFLACLQINHSPWGHNHFARDEQGGIMASIRSETLRTTRLPTPPPEEMSRIEQVLRAAADDLRQIENMMGKVALQKTGLMQDLLTGNRRVTALLE